MALDGNGKLIEEQTSGGRPYVATDKNLNAHRSTPTGRNGHTSVPAAATTTEANSPFDVELIVFLTNDGTDDIAFNFNQSITQAGAFTLKPGETIGNFPRACTTLYYKAASGTQSFRALGVK